MVDFNTIFGLVEQLFLKLPVVSLKCFWPRNKVLSSKLAHKGRLIIIKHGSIIEVL